ncbi:MAG: ligase-associated DNA damage response endonuclease PdeM [Leeuwenhoekiella sp.]
MYQEISILEKTFFLHPCGVIFWPEKSMLLIADVHLGKVSHFRKFGSAVPQQAVKSNFNALTRVIEDFEPEIVCFLGDLFHSSFNKEWLLFEKWIHTRDEKFILVAGNHDIISPAHYGIVGMKMASELIIGDFLLTHHPTERKGFFNFSGHIHPGIRLSGLGRQTLKLSCFFKSENQLILPAFGTFTGNYYLKPEPGDAVFAITKNEVIQVY